MARQESDREDLMAEAVALRRRVELQIPGKTEHLIAGFRDDGRISLYFGPDPVYHFDAEGRLRRAFVNGNLYRTQGTTLARLTRKRTKEETLLQRHDLSEPELHGFLTEMRSRVQNLWDRIDAGRVAIVQQVPEGDPVLPKLVTALNTVLTTEFPLAEGFKGKR